MSKTISIIRTETYFYWINFYIEATFCKHTEKKSFESTEILLAGGETNSLLPVRRIGVPFIYCDKISSEQPNICLSICIWS